MIYLTVDNDADDTEQQVDDANWNVSLPGIEPHIGGGGGRGVGGVS